MINEKKIPLNSISKQNLRLNSELKLIPLITVCVNIIVSKWYERNECLSIERTSLPIWTKDRLKLMKISNKRCVNEQKKLKKQNKRTRKLLAHHTN